jgi:putative acetyltransferase
MEQPPSLVLEVVRIRLEEPDDLNAIRAVHAASFPTESEANLVEALRAFGRLCVSLVAVTQDHVVGHVAFSPVSLAGATGGVGLAPVAVLAEYRRQGIAARLIRKGLEACEQAGCRFVVVLGEPSYYQRFGFIAASKRGLQDEYGGGEAFQVLELRPGTIPGSEGLVRYAPEFTLLDGQGAV